jgi:hypothetical protein
MIEASLVNTVQTVGILTGIVIALFQIRDMNKTRQAELYLRLWERWNTKEFSEQRYKAYSIQCTDQDEFDEKYDGRKNPDVFAAWITFGRSILGLAELNKKRLIDIDFLDNSMISDIANWWTVFGALEKDSWEKGDPNFEGHFPFIRKVIDYDRRIRPFRYNENGEIALPWLAKYTWVPPEEMDPSKIKRK